MNRTEIAIRDEQIVHELLTTPDTLAEIGARYEMSAANIYRIGNKGGVTARPYRPYYPRNPARDAEIADLIRAGTHTLDAIGKVYGISRERVRQIGNRNGVKSKIKRLDPIKVQAAVELFHRGMPLKHAAESVGLTNPDSLGPHLARRGLYTPSPAGEPWSDRDDAFLRRHYKRPGWSAPRIGDAIGRTRNECIGRANRLGLCAPHPNAEFRRVAA